MAFHTNAKLCVQTLTIFVSGHVDFTSFMTYIPFFAKLLHVIMDSPLSIKNLEQARDRVMRKYTSSPDQMT